jgi:hypothetical protein
MCVYRYVSIRIHPNNAFLERLYKPEQTSIETLHLNDIEENLPPFNGRGIAIKANLEPTQ